MVFSSKRMEQKQRIREYKNILYLEKNKSDTILFGVGQMKENKRYAKSKN